MKNIKEYQIRNSLRYIASEDQKAFIRDLKPVYKEATKEVAAMALDEIKVNWGEKYPKIIEK